MRCLEGLLLERADLLDIVVVDASSASVEADVVGLWSGITYVHAPELAGWMTSSRNRGLLQVQGDIVAFLDDDVIIRSGWAAKVRDIFAAGDVDGLAGQTCNGLPGEEVYDLPVGRLLPDGRLTAGFASKVEGLEEVQHGIGANMSFTREVLCRLGGFRDDYPGTALREDTDMFLRVGQVGGRVVFGSNTVDHLPAPHVRGRRFDTRYKLYGRRNHMVLLARHGGMGSQRLRRWVAGQFAEVPSAGGLRRQAERLGVVVLGVAFGFGALLKERRWSAMRPERSGPEAERIRAALSRQDWI